MDLIFWGLPHLLSFLPPNGMYMMNVFEGLCIYSFPQPSANGDGIIKILLAWMIINFHPFNQSMESNVVGLIAVCMLVLVPKNFN